MTSVHASFSGKMGSGGFDANLIRNIVLNVVRANNVKFRNKYGRIVIACDSTYSWRKKVFAYYKAHRKGDREKYFSHINWGEVFPLFDSIKAELAEYTSYPIIEVDGAEGDDVISVLVQANADIPNMILSADKDFVQLQAFTSVQQYDPIRQKAIRCDDPVAFLEEHIINGDRNDGVPNILSDDDVFVNPAKRQGKVTAKRMETWRTTPVSDWEPKLQRNWKRNQTLIDLRVIPPSLKAKILEQFAEQQMKDQHRVFDYIKKHQLVGLLDHITDF